jgi:hypothetical protein
MGDTRAGHTHLCGSAQSSVPWLATVETHQYKPEKVREDNRNEHPGNTTNVNHNLEH